MPPAGMDLSETMVEGKRNQIACGCKTKSYHKLHKKFKLCLVKKLPNPEENDNISESDKTRIEEGHFSTIYTPDYYTWDKAWTAGGLNYERISRDLRSVRTVGRDESLKRTLFNYDPQNRELWGSLHLPTVDSRLLSLFANYVVKGYGYRDVKVDHESAQMWNDIIHTLVQREVYEKLFQPLGRSNANEKLLRLVWGGPLTANESADAVGEELKESTLRRRQETFWAASSAEQKHMWINSKDGILGRGLESEESTASSANQSASNAGTGITQETSPEYEGHSRNPATATFGDQTASDASSQISQETLVDDDDDDSVNAASSANLSHPATNRLIGAENPPPPMYQPTGDANDDGPDVPVQRRSLIKRASTWFETEVTVRAGTEHLIVAPDPSQQVNNGREEYPPYTWGKRGMDRAILIAWPLSDYWRPRPPPRPVVRARRRKAAYKGNLKRLKADHRAERGH